MTNPAFVLLDAMEGIGWIFRAVDAGSLPRALQGLVGLRASQINGASACVHSHCMNLVDDGEDPERIVSVAEWRQASCFDERERIALELTEAVTRIADRCGDAVDDVLWARVAEHFDEDQVAALILLIGVTNMFNRLNSAIKAPAGASWI